MASVMLPQVTCESRDLVLHALNVAERALMFLDKRQVSEKFA